MNINEAEKCMAAFKDVCEQADQNALISSEECHYWVFEEGYKAAMLQMTAVAKLNNTNNTNKSSDDVTESLMHGFTLLERFKIKTAA